MHPILVQWGSFALPAWHTFYVLGALAAYVLLITLRRRFLPHIDEGELARLYALAYVAGYVGARLLSVFVEQPEVEGVGATLAALATLGPMTFYGGALLAFAVGALFIRLRRLPFADTMDIAIPAGLLGLVLGRIGCYLNGDDYGKAVPLGPDGTAPWYAVVFPNLRDDLPRYPVQLWEALLVLALVIALVALFGRLRAAFRPGAVAFFAVVAYANLRFGLEFLRDDFRGFAFGTWLSTSQFISLVILAACGLTLPFWIRR